MSSYKNCLKNFLIITGILVFSVNLCSAQQQKSDFWQNVRFGGGLGLGFGNDSFYIGVSPSGIYQVSDKFATGLGLNFNYSKFGDSEFTAYGASWLNFFNPIPQIQLSAELQPLRVSTNYPSNFPDLDENYWTTALFLGVGYSTPHVTFGIQYDVLYDSGRSIYSDPWIPFIRVYF
ncbi:alpha-ketoglutarate decarboxylase [Eudoraea chungangensis]|uniref:alpha-ketoglutarate decarboxylase n=1 Tax=Eudoraea chungangensis TaxID=1481905 RepID=UPI0023EDD2A1|nr:alpha-ketoglutarate decarboxylase [Eudoraea chungangensis]